MVNQRLLKAFAKCLEDYQGEIKHTKMMTKEVDLKNLNSIIFHKNSN